MHVPQPNRRGKPREANPLRDLPSTTTVWSVEVGHGKAWAARSMARRTGWRVAADGWMRTPRVGVVIRQPKRARVFWGAASALWPITHNDRAPTKTGWCQSGEQNSGMA